MSTGVSDVAGKQLLDHDVSYYFMILFLMGHQKMAFIMFACIYLKFDFEYQLKRLIYLNTCKLLHILMPPSMQNGST